MVSHQLPVWTVRRFLEGKRMWHDPRKRECSLASLTSLTFEDEQLVRITYSEPAGTSTLLMFAETLFRKTRSPTRPKKNCACWSSA